MDNKTKVESLRTMADHFDEIANLSNDIEDSDVALHYRNIAEHLRKEAEKLDPPQPEWKDGDLVRSQHGYLWEHSGGTWFRRHTTFTYEELVSLFGPLRRVYVSDPSENQVVVSVDEIYHTALLAQADKDEQEESSLTIAGIRVAKAVREQLGESEDPRDMLSNF